VILAVDVHYADDHATVAGVAFADWADAQPQRSFVQHLPAAASYEPGRFFERELPCIMALLQSHQLQPACVLVDGYVFLDGQSEPGLGKHLFDALRGQASVIGVAKTSFRLIGLDHWVLRGDSKRPLYVTCVGEDLANAKAAVAAMHGPHRIPSLLKLVDQLCRGRVAGA
jgi:deoxyribonuclease V